MELRTKNVVDDPARTHCYDEWSYIAVEYALRVFGLRSEFYRLADRDPAYAKMILPVLEKRGELPTADDLDKTLRDLDAHMNNQPMKAAATLTASNETKRTGRCGGGAAGNN